MFAVGIAYLHHCLVVVKVVILLSEGESALREVVDIHRNVLLVGTEGIVVEHAVAEHGVLLLQCQQVGFGLCGLNLVEQRLHRSYAFALAAGRIHSQLVEIGKLGLNGIAFVGLLLKRTQNAVDAFLVVVVEDVEGSVARIGWRQRIVLAPSGGCEVIEVGAGGYRSVEVLFVQPRCCLGIAHYGGCRNHHHCD